MTGERCITPGGAFYAFANVSETGRGAKELQVDFLEKGGVATLAGTAFGAHGEGFVRLSYANSVASLEEGLRRMRSVLEA